MSDVVVLLGSSFADLETFGTRWRAVLTRWDHDPRIASLTVVDFPHFGRTLGCRPLPSWLDGAQALALQVPGRVRGGFTDGLGWSLVARALRGALEPSAERVVVAATPLSAPLLGRLGAARTGFDAVDDWRALPSMASARARVEAGYRAAARADAVTAVSGVLADRLSADFGGEVQTVGNGVSVTVPGPVPEGLPAEPFALYVGSVQERVDLELLGAVARRLPVVVAGPADARHAECLRALPLTWLGRVPVEQVQGLTARAAVGLLPHRRDALTESMAPMKLLEYVASGLRTVSTRLPDVEAHPGVVVADGTEDFVEAVLATLARGPVEVPESWRRAHDWDLIADRLLRLHVLGEPAESVMPDA